MLLLVFSFLIVVTLKFQMQASMIFSNVCKYFILRDSRRALPWFCAHVRWHRGNHPPLKRSAVLKRICLVSWYLFFSLSLYFSCDKILAHVSWHQEEYSLKENMSWYLFLSCFSHCLCFVSMRRNIRSCEVTCSSYLLLKVLHLCHNVATRCDESVPLILRQCKNAFIYWVPVWSVKVVGCCWIISRSGRL